MLVNETHSQSGAVEKGLAYVRFPKDISLSLSTLSTIRLGSIAGPEFHQLIVTIIGLEPQCTSETRTLEYFKIPSAAV